MAATKTVTKSIKSAATQATAKKAAPAARKSKSSPKAAPEAKAPKKATRKSKKGVPTLTAKEAVAMRDLWDSSKGNGHDFGYTDDLPHIPKPSRGGIIASLQEKGLITVYEPVTTDSGTYTQFEFSDVGQVMFSNFENSKELVIQVVQKEARERAEKAIKKEDKAAGRGKAAKAKETQPEAAKLAVPKSWRVFPISDSLRQSLKGVRDAAPSQMSLRDVVTFCVQRELPQLIAALRELQCDTQRSMETDRVRPIRMQVDVPTLDQLRAASNAVGLPAQTLMLACCRLATSPKSSD